MKLDHRITIGVVITLFLQAGAAFVWAGQASARLANVERRIEASPEVAERLARLEAQMEDARRTLARIETRLERAR